MNLTKEQREQIALEVYKEQPTELLAHTAILKLAELAISTNASSVTQTTQATFNGKRYELEMVVKYQEITQK